MDNSSTWQELSRQVAGLCSRIPATAGPAVLARELAVLAPELRFREVLSRGGWYRLGGVVDADNVHISDHIETWAERELAAHDEDMVALCDHYAGRGLRATRLTGRTRYLVATTGAGAADFVQIEIEELQEIVSHPLFAAAGTPSGIEELIDPRHLDATGGAAAEPIGAPLLVLRRLTPVAAFLARMRVQKPEAQPIHRFVEAWEASSAGTATQFSNHWVVAVREHLDRYRQSVLHAAPVAALNGAAPKFVATFGMQGLALHQAMAHYDKAAGFPMAWFFHMLTVRSAPYALANAVISDVLEGFHYLPARDIEVVKQWLYQPYAF